MILSADKGLGYTILYEKDVLAQYTAINIKQHFGETNITEDWYISSILDYIGQAKEHLPRELSKIISKKDFEVCIESPKLGILRLLPKILKLKKVDESEVKNLTCRG